MLKLKATASEVRTIRKYGGLDNYLLKSGKGVQRNLGAHGEMLRDTLKEKILH